MAAVAWDRDALLASPLHAALAPWLARLPVDRFPDCDALNALGADVPALVNRAGQRIRFVPDTQPWLRREHYEQRIARSGEAPTRPGDWHDLFNALVWLAFPRTKASLNTAHAFLLDARPDEAKHRGRARDVLTLFDEGGAIVACADAALERLLREHAWRALFVDARARCEVSMRCFVFGHALLDKGRAPYRGLTAKALVVPVAPALLAALGLVERLDQALAEVFRFAPNDAPDDLAAHWRRLLTPLPLLGIPGWDVANGDSAYYDDVRYFRPKGASE